MRYIIVISPDPDDRGYTVTVPSLSGCVTQGATLDEAFANARDAISEYLEGETPESLAATGAHTNAIVAEINIPA
jgi:predicted RNase H-like HicB family nuclease